MSENETIVALFGLTLAIAEDIYFYKCLFYNVPSLSDSDWKKCIDEAVEVLQEVLDNYKRASEFLEGKRATEGEHEMS